MFPTYQVVPISYVLHPNWKNISIYKQAVLLSEIYIKICGAELSETEISVRTYWDNLVYEDNKQMNKTHTLSRGFD